MNIFKRIFVHLLASMLFGLSTHAQAPRLEMEFLTTENDLPDNTITSLHQDQLGYIWIGTRIGLARYDGYDMVSYQPTPGDSMSLQGRTIMYIHENEERNLWIGSDWGLHYFDRGTELFTNIRLSEGENIGIHYLHEDQEGNIWTISGAENELHRYNPKSREFTPMQTQSGKKLQVGKPHSQLKRAPILEDESGNFWV